MDSENKLIIGDELLDYMDQLMSVAEILAGAATKVETLKATMSGTAAYEGQASEELTLFGESLYAQLIKLSQLYTKAAQYAQATYISFDDSDIAWSKMIEFLTVRGGK